MKICSCCGFKLLDNQKYCPRCGLPISSKPLADTSEKITSDDEKAEVKTQPKLNISDGNKKKHISKSIIIIITIIILGAFLLLSIILNKETNISNKETDEVKEEDNDLELRNMIKDVKTKFANIMKSEDIVFIGFDESNNRYLFETVYESSQEQYYYYPETREITITVPGVEAIINKDFSLKTTFYGEPSDEAYDWLIYVRRRTYNEEIIKVNDSIGNIAKDKFKNMLDYAISPNLECEIDGVELYLVRVNKGKPNYEVNEFLLGNDGNTYDYWEAISSNRLVEVYQ